MASYDLLYGLVAIAIVFALSTIYLFARGKRSQVNALGVWGILTFTYKEAIRTKWVLIFGVIFFLLAVDIPDLYLSAAGNLPPEYLKQNISDLLSVAFPLIPLLPLPVGAVSIVDERESGTLQYLLSNPVTKGEFFIGRAVGILLATTTVIIIGFGAAAMVSFTTGISNYYSVIMIMLFATMLNAVMVGIALIVSEFSKRKATAMGLGLMVWFVLAVVSSLDQLVVSVNLRAGAEAALTLVLLDPIETARDLTIYGAGLGAQEQSIASLVGLHVWRNNVYPFTFLSVVVWIVVTFAIGYLVFRHQDAA
ncbi:MAG: ABC transporter permease subunit [Nitrososphaerota archaeon]|nr:ABC transporter permease subunit [Nitrososphaerota archaeon]MDG6967226.1 ABC transporter permease subunit [Nitrososphaerota archaeon]MDG6978861.1 ABC transporter permease subunit [Nitrososphaerota archaeon]